MAIDELDTKTLRIVEEQKLIELRDQKQNVKNLQSELAQINKKLQKNEKLSEDEIKYISELGWLSALSVTIAALATSI